MTALVVTDRCRGCGACLLTCPERAVRPAAPHGRLIILPDRCTGCGECVDVCPVDAIDAAPGARTVPATTTTTTEES